MKTKTIFQSLAIMGVSIFLNSTLINAQVIDLQTSAGLRWGDVNPVPGFNAQAIGIGNFISPNGPRAALHVNTLLLPATTLYTPGLLFRTDGTNTQANIWSMFTGATSTTTTEKGAIFTSGNLEGRK